MTQDEIIKMAKQAGLGFLLDARFMCHQEVKDFAKLVAQHEKERIATSIERLPFGDTAASFAIYVRELKDE
jgi:hypothetical protein